MPIGGKLLLKGGLPLKGVSKKKHKKPKQLETVEEGQHEEDEEVDTRLDAKGTKIAPTAINVMSGKSYEQEFDLEQQRMAKPKVKTTPWGSSYREAPEILHGYSHKVKGDTASERLDMRSATKSDKFCK
eukprot:GHRR01003184.1.p1 GENE.GHRR01003184.1~~GHRR01003184.1.p1  ORF type:complete len:129 (+),score=46.39 GHRR01003184.1:327-713(+)